MQNETTLIDSSNRFEKRDFQNVTKHRQYIYHFEIFFATIKNQELLPLKSPLFGLDGALKVRIT